MNEMRKVSPYRLYMLSRMAWKQHLRSVERRNRILPKGEERLRISGSRRLGRKVPLPQVFCLDENYEETSQALANMREELMRNFRITRRKKVRGKGDLRLGHTYYDFRSIERISPAAALVLAAEFDRFRRLSRRRLWPVHIEEWDPVVRFILREIGFLSLLEVNNEEYVMGDEDDLRLVRFITGVGSEGLLAAQLNHRLREIAGEIEGENFLFDGVTEAMTNVSHHAYPSDHAFDIEPLKGRWWLTGTYSHNRRVLNVIIYDQGITIPGHLPRSRKREQIRAKLQDLRNAVFGSDVTDDALIIQAAMELHRSATGEDHRGKGLANMCDFIDNSADGYLRIISRRGEYIYRKGEQPVIKEHPISIGGTLIEWEVQR